MQHFNCINFIQIVEIHLVFIKLGSSISQNPDVLEKNYIHI